MDYGLPWTPDIISEENLKFCPFHLFLNHGLWVLCKHVSTNLFGKRINIPLKIHEYDSVGDLLLDFLQNKHWFCTLSSDARERLEEDIKYVFLFESSSSKRLTNKQKFQLIQQYTRREIQGSTAIAAPILSSLFSAADAHNLPHPKTYSEAMDLAAQIKFKIPENDILVFGNSDELATWALSYLIEHDKLIGRCESCSRYYIKPHGNSKYCGDECYENRKTIGECLGEPEIKRRYKCINQWFVRKQASHAVYEYCDSGNLPDTYDAAALFSDLDIGSDPAGLSEFIFKAEHFSIIKDAYKEEYDTRYSRLKKMKKAVTCQNISEEDYKRAMDTFLQWLDNVRVQLDYFSKYHDYSSRTK